MAVIGHTTITPTQLGQANIAIAPGTVLYTAVASTTGLLKAFDICNTTIAAITVSVYLVPVGGTAGAANAILFTVSVGIAGTYTWRGTQVIPAGGSIQAIASAVGCTFTGAGAVYSTI